MNKKSIENARKHSKQWHESIRQKVFSDSSSREAYERTRQEIELALMLRETREKADISQETMAERLHTTRSAISRLESSGFDQRHSPSLKTLLKYVNALGYTLKFKLVHAKSDIRR